MDIEKLFNAVSDTVRKTRSSYHLTLGGLIDALDAADPGAEVVFDDGLGVGPEGSYRGFYADLALDTGPICIAAELAKRMKAAAGSTYEGYKGGDFNMGLDTPLWRASYGNCGEAIMAAKVVGKRIVLITKEIE